jgi:hypothetical protein
MADARCKMHHNTAEKGLPENVKSIGVGNYILKLPFIKEQCSTGTDTVILR